MDTRREEEIWSTKEHLAKDFGKRPQTNLERTREEFSRQREVEGSLVLDLCPVCPRAQQGLGM
jgi:hypothetical protein